MPDDSQPVEAGKERVDGEVYEYPFRVTDVHGEVIRDDLDNVPPFLNRQDIDILAGELEERFEDGIDGYHDQFLVQVLRKLPDSEWGRGELPDWIVPKSEAQENE